GNGPNQSHSKRVFFHKSCSEAVNQVLFLAPEPGHAVLMQESEQSESGSRQEIEHERTHARIGLCNTEPLQKIPDLVFQIDGPLLPAEVDVTKLMIKDRRKIFTIEANEEWGTNP